MAMKLYNDVDIQDIADAIREVNGSSDTYKVSEMAAVIRTFTYEPVDPNLLTMNDGLINRRFNSSGALSNMNGYFVTDFFEYSGSGGLRIVKGYTNMGGLGTTVNFSNCRFAVYDASKTLITTMYISRTEGTNYIQFVTDGDDLVKYDLTNDTDVSDWSAVKYIRMTLALDNASSAIASVDDVLNSGMKIYAV